MPMLAEPRKRSKWIVSGKSEWENDDSKFGQKLLEKMGWSKGKGLGKEQQGDPNCIKVAVKGNKKGIGFKGYDDQWINHFEGYEEVLSKLNDPKNSDNSANDTPKDSDNSANGTPNDSNDDEDQSIQSLERRSKVSRARVHYHKFTRGKDLSQYSLEDIACITGSKRAKQKVKEEKAKEVPEEDLNERIKLSGVTVINKGSIKDYFSEKMAQLKFTLPIAPPQSSGYDSEEEYRIGFSMDTKTETKEEGEEEGTIAMQKHYLSSFVKEADNDAATMKKQYFSTFVKAADNDAAASKKQYLSNFVKEEENDAASMKRHYLGNFVKETPSDAAALEVEMENNSDATNKKKSKKKKRERNIVQEEDAQQEVETGEQENEDMEKAVETEDNDVLIGKKKKKKKKAKGEKRERSPEYVEQQDSGMEEDDQRNKREEIAIAEDQYSIDNVSTEQCDVLSDKKKKKKKKKKEENDVSDKKVKKKRKIESGEDLESAQERENDECHNEDNQVKKKKSKNL